MKLPRSFGKPRKRKLLLVRRVVGSSMEPTLRPGQIIVVTGSISLRPGDIVVVHHEGLEKIKRIASIKAEKAYLLGDNPAYSTDSRQFGWLPVQNIAAKIIWPQHIHKKLTGE